MRKLASKRVLFRTLAEESLANARRFFSDANHSAAGANHRKVAYAYARTNLIFSNHGTHISGTLAGSLAFLWFLVMAAAGLVGGGVYLLGRFTPPPAAAEAPAAPEARRAA